MNISEEKILKGKTFSLYGIEASSDNYFNTIKFIVSFLREKYFESEEEFLHYLHSFDRKKRFLKKLSKSDANETIIFEVLKYLRANLSCYTEAVKVHLKSLSLSERIDKTISTSEEQYHLYMAEIELANRIYADQFRNCQYKIALLPHCLHDLKRNCMSKLNEIDYVCKGCSKHCYINHVNMILRKNNVDAYIWRTADLKGLLKMLRKKYKTVGVMGIACIPELMSGMNHCIKFGLPVIGVPLDANRCRRWMGEFYPNTVNLDRVKDLVKIDGK